MKRKVFVISLVLAFAALSIAAVVVGFSDWILMSAPGSPAAGFLRLWADSGSSTIKCKTPAGAACYFDTSATGVTIQTNSVNNTSQTTLNLQNGGSVVVANPSGGNVTITGPTFQTNTTNNSAQTTLNLVGGANVTLTNTSAGNVTIAAASLTVGGVNSQTTGYTALTGDNTKLITFACGSPCTLTLPASPPSSTWWILVQNTGSNALTVSRNGLNIDGAASNLTVNQNQGTVIYTDGSNYFTERGMGTAGSTLTLQTNGVNNTSQTTLNFQDANGCTWTNPSGGVVQVGCSGSSGGVNAKTAGYTATGGDAGKLITFNCSSACTLTLPASPPSATWFIAVQSTGVGILTVNRNSLNIDGAAANVPVSTDRGLFVYTDNSNYFTSRGMAGDFPDVKMIPAANCNNTTAGNGWSIGSGGSVVCRGGSSNLGGYISITSTSSTFAQFAIEVPADWDTATFPFIRFQVASSDSNTGHTIIPQIQVACLHGDGTSTDDPGFNSAHNSSTITLNSTANQFWTTSSLQMNSTDVNGCLAGSVMIIQVGRATDTATDAKFYSATVTFPRLLTVQAN